MKGRVFFINFLTTFKKLNPYTAKTLNTAKTQRIHLCDHKIFAPLRKFLRLCGVSGQSVIEYFIILAVVVAITALSVSAFLGRGKESGELIFNKAVTRIADNEVFIAGRLASCSNSGPICTDDEEGLGPGGDPGCPPGIPCNPVIPGQENCHYVFHNCDPNCVDNNRDGLGDDPPGCTVCTEADIEWVCEGEPGPGIDPGPGEGPTCWQAAPPPEGLPHRFTEEPNIALPPEIVNYPGAEISLTSAKWAEISGQTLVPGRYYYTFSFGGTPRCFCPVVDGERPSCSEEGGYVFIRLNITG